MSMFWDGFIAGVLGCSKYIVLGIMVFMVDCSSDEGTSCASTCWILIPAEVEYCVEV